MRPIDRPLVVILVLLLWPLCMASSCSRDFRDAATRGATDYVSATALSILQTMLPIADAFTR